MKRMADAAFSAIATLVQSHSGHVLGQDKMYLVETRLAPLMRRAQIPDLAALAQRIGAGSDRYELTREVVEAMTINESLFFRDIRPFTHVRCEGLPRLHAARPASAKLRFWSAAAASGQEAYSLAMLVADSRAMLGGRSIEIVGTDIARKPLERAREGVFTQFEVRRGVPEDTLRRYFREEARGWSIDPKLQAMVKFREHNLLSDLSVLGRFDIVFCRNVLIYFDPPTKAKVLNAIARQMTPDGLLYLGAAETTHGLTTSFVPLTSERGVYRLAEQPQPGAVDWAA